MQIASYVFLPQDSPHLTVFYLVWMGAFFAVHTIWDIKTDKTPPFHLDRLKDKVSVLHDAAGLSSSVLILAALVGQSIQKDITIPLIIAAGSGILRSIPGLCPYRAAAS